jgi:hypothetical protein
MRRLSILFLIAAAVGCSKDTALFPLDVGRSTRYVVRTGMVEFVAPLQVKGKVAVAGTEGAELQGPLGTYRVAWKGGVLLAERLGGTRFRPAIPLLVAGAPNAKKSWSGAIGYAGEVVKATAELEQQPSTISLGTKKFDCTEVRVVAKLPSTEIELVTHYAEGIGIIRQEQRVGSSDPGSKVLYLGMEYLEGK